MWQKGEKASPARRQSDPGGPIELNSLRVHECNVPRKPRDDKIAPTPHSGLVQSCAALAAGPVDAPVKGKVLVTPPVLSPIAVGKNAETQRGRGRRDIGEARLLPIRQTSTPDLCVLRSAIPKDPTRLRGCYAAICVSRSTAANRGRGEAAAAAAGAARGAGPSGGDF